MKAILVSHVDHDGLAPGLLAEFFKLSFDKIVHWDYGFELIPESTALLESFDSIVMTDLSCSEEYYNKLISMGKTVEIYDHHDSSSWIKDKPNCVHDQTRSGTKIFFEEYLCKRVSRLRPIVAEYVELVHTYDTWQKNSPLWPEALNLQRVLFKYALWGIPDPRTSFDRFFTATQRKLQMQDYWSWNSTELRYIQEAKAREEEVYRSAVKQLSFRHDSKGKTFAVFSAGGKISFVADRLLREDNIPVDYLIIVQTYKGISGKLSGRSLDERFDCTTLAPLNGHKGAAGGTIEKTDAEQFLEHEDWSIKYKDEMTSETDFVWKATKVRTR